MEKRLILESLFFFIIFPGFLFSAGVGLLASWFDRKLTARLQWRQGPPWYQSFLDIAKLMAKEIIIPQQVNKVIFLALPIIGLTVAVLSSVLICLANLWPARSFIGDIVVTVYLLVIPALSLIFGAAVSRNPLASLGASREIKLMLAYELPFLLSIFVPIIKTQWSLSLENIILFQVHHGNILFSPAGIIAFIVALLCIQAKLGLCPFDMSEAETEIMGGVLIEYSGAALAIFKLMKSILLFVLPLFLVTIFWGGISINGWQILIGVLKIIAVLVLIVIIKNTNPRLRVDQAIKFFWGPLTVIALLAVILALLGI